MTRKKLEVVMTAVLAGRRPRGVRGMRRETSERTGSARAEARDAPRGAQVTNQGATRGHARAVRVGALVGLVDSAGPSGRRERVGQKAQMLECGTSSFLSFSTFS